MKLKKKYMSLVSVLLALCLVIPMAACGDDTVSVDSVEMDQSTLRLNVGEEATLTYTVLPQSAGNASAKWLSTDPNIATVNNGVVKGIKDGEAAIRVTVGGKSSDCVVTVIDPSNLPVPVSGVSLDKNTLSLDIGGTGTLVATIEPADSTVRTVEWSSSDSAVAKVSETGAVTAVGAGKAIITAKAEGYSDSCVVTVNGEVGEPELFVAKVESLSTRKTPFIMAMDSSELLSVEAARKESNASGFKNFDGQEEDVLKILKDNGITDIRIRVWNNPKDESGNWYGGGNCDVDNAVELSKRCEQVGLGVIIDFHYSDFWADPGKQTVPKAWENMDLNAKTEALKTFTKESLQKIKDTNVKITMVQIGNETTGGMAGEMADEKAGEKDWTNICKLMNAGSQAVREVTGTVAEGGAKVAVHFTNAGNNDYPSRAQTLKNNNVDYDVFGSSWYPYYTSAGTLNGLVNQFMTVHDTYHKEVMVLETGYAWTNEDFDGCGNTALETTTRPVTVQGMANAVRDVIEKVADLGEWGLGVSYWGGTWIAASESNDGNANRELCKKYGCGWATSYAKGYESDANDGGSTVDNNAFFRSDGTPIEALKVFGYVKEGHTTNLRADYLEDTEVHYTVNEGPIELPKTISIVLNNGSAQTTDVFWAIEKTKLAEYINQVGMYPVEGTTNFGGTCHCNVWVMNVNLLKGGSFEEEEGFESYGDNTTKFVQSDLGDWKLTHTGGTSELQLFVSNNQGNARMGKQSFHFWDNGAVNFDLTQTLSADELKEDGNGKYGCSFDFQGADGENLDIYAYITVKYKDGTEKTFPADTKAQMNGWRNWSRTSVTGVELDLSVVESITVGIHVKADFTGAGPWGNIDNAQFYFEG